MLDKPNQESYSCGKQDVTHPKGVFHEFMGRFVSRHRKSPKLSGSMLNVQTIFSIDAPGDIVYKDGT